MKNLENGSRAQQNSASNLSTLMQEVLAKAKKQGATDAMVTVNQDSGFSVDVRMKQVATVAFHENKGISLIIYKGHRKGVASSTDTSEAALDSLVSAAWEIAKVSAEDPCFGLPDKELMTNIYPDLDLYHPWSITTTEAIEMALTCEAAALSMDPRISNSDGANISTHTFCEGFANTYGGHGLIQGSRHSISCSLIAKEGESMQRDYDYTTAREPEALLDLQALAKNTVERTVSRLGAKPIKTQKAPVILSSRVSSSIISSFINAISGGNLYRKNTFLLDSLGKAIFPSGIDIYEKPHLPRGLGSSPFDNEGVPTRNNIFVQNGIVVQYLLNSYSARRMGLKTSANCGGAHNLIIEPNAGGLNELLHKMDKGLLVTELMGQGVNGLTGDYSRGASGFWVENGKIQYPVEEITIAGNLKDMFLNIISVGNDADPNRPTKCGSLFISEMMIAGR
jgi:PmbA protein